MKIDFTGCDYEAKTYDYADGVTLKIRSFPATEASVRFRDGAQEISGRDMFRQFDHCLTGWSGVVGADDKPLPCTSEVKRQVFDFRNANDNFGALVDFVAVTVAKLGRAEEDTEKNL